MIELDLFFDKYDFYNLNLFKVKRNFNKSYIIYLIKDLVIVLNRINVEFVGLLFVFKKSFFKNKKFII